MAGLDDRVRGFLASWPIVENHLNELLQEAIRVAKEQIEKDPGYRDKCYETQGERG